jgi:hypothetical protein
MCDAGRQPPTRVAGDRSTGVFEIELADVEPVHMTQVN